VTALTSSQCRELLYGFLWSGLDRFEERGLRGEELEKKPGSGGGVVGRVEGVSGGKVFTLVGNAARRNLRKI